MIRMNKEARSQRRSSNDEAGVCYIDCDRGGNRQGREEGAGKQDMGWEEVENLEVTMNNPQAMDKTLGR
jgi:hypothetical protein